jgi:hypothetical protein
MASSRELSRSSKRARRATFSVVWIVDPGNFHRACSYHRARGARRGGHSNWHRGLWACGAHCDRAGTITQESWQTSLVTTNASGPPPPPYGRWRSRLDRGRRGFAGDMVGSSAFSSLRDPLRHPGEESFPSPFARHLHPLRKRLHERGLGEAVSLWVWRLIATGYIAFCVVDYTNVKGIMQVVVFVPTLLVWVAISVGFERRRETPVARPAAPS